MKRISSVLLAILLLVLSPSAAFGDTASRTIHLTLGETTAQVNGQRVTMTAPPQLISNRTLVPLRFISEALGCDVDWIASTHTATVTMENQKIQVPIGQNYVLVNGTQTAIEVPGQLINGSTYVPLRFIGERLGAEVDYNSTTKGISMGLNTYKNTVHNFEMVLPDGWIVKEENEKKVVLNHGKEAVATFSLVNKAEGATPADMNAEQLFEGFAGKPGFNYIVKEKMIAGAYLENGIFTEVFCVFLDKGIYVVTVIAPAEAFDRAFDRECVLMLNTMKNVDAA
ncbi:copper amine oxidase N-terminal domain-containing protein [Aminipila butyrica]|uniref:Copper amine oxidase N-terminal domain-containing protein n=1 Tax=Aminipila butyrica TaxID=433296 RepID=A0A858BVF9_9FIRM|nr:copper amine oxidase N-terminal domain-containing protein [Aminipila butyrica]QIB69577.1 copper amine oxidase N-terminal domain-containing protein [Aminipila butyrica]